jgi:hypothetical protein
METLKGISIQYGKITFLAKKDWNSTKSINLQIDVPACLTLF